MLLVAILALAGAGAALAQDATPPPAVETGTLNLTCGIANVLETDVVACSVSIDAAPQPDIPAGAMVSFPLPMGSHTVVVTPVGAQAIYWEPTSIQTVVSLTSATYPRAYTALFLKQGHLVVNLKQEGVTADFYVDTVLVSPQVASVDLWLSPNKSHTIGIKNVVDPAANGIYGWNDSTQYAYTTAGSDKTLTVNLIKKPIKGFLKIKCVLPSVQPTDLVVCRPTIDTIVQADILPGAEFVYPLDKGSHAVQVDLVGDSAHLWAPQTRAQKSTIYAGYTTTYSPIFTKSGHLVVTLDQPGVVADFYLDGVLVATQVAGFDAWVTPFVNHKVEVKAVFDPLAGALYHFNDATSYASVSPGAEKPVVVKLVKVVTAATVGVLCLLQNAPPPDYLPAFCDVYIDGEYRGQVASSSATVFLVSAGHHQVAIDLGPQDVWSADPTVHEIDLAIDENIVLTAIYFLNWQ